MMRLVSMPETSASTPIAGEYTHAVAASDETQRQPA
ncbi:hypothetical protein LMIY3S_00210 [Labrys miyagiensis]